LGVGEVRQYNPQPLPLHCCHSLKKLVQQVTEFLTIPRNFVQICIEKFRIISRNLGHFRMVYKTKKNIQNIRNFEYTKCRKHPIPISHKAKGITYFKIRNCNIDSLQGIANDRPSRSASKRVTSIKSSTTSLQENVVISGPIIFFYKHLYVQCYALYTDFL
jgi:hypothetical protein